MSTHGFFGTMRRACRPLMVGAAFLCFGGSAMANGYLQTNMTSDGSAPSTITDSNLVNPWGMAYSPTSPFWIADNGTGLSTLYNGVGEPLSLVVTIPTPPGQTTPAAPDGMIWNPTTDFVVTGPNNTGGPAVFLWATEDGTIAAWNPAANLHSAILEVDQSSVQTVFKGIAWAFTRGGKNKVNWLYATDFRHGQVDVFDKNFAWVGSFTDPNLPSGFAPFGIQNLDNLLYVTFAKQDAAKHDDVAGPGFGFVDVFRPNGKMVRRFASRGVLNSPWGVAQAPADFGQFSGDLLVSNFGDGKINAFDPATGAFQGVLKDGAGMPIFIDGLWAIKFGNGFSAGLQNVLYFTAGPNHESNGLFGQIQALPAADGDFD